MDRGKRTNREGRDGLADVIPREKRNGGSCRGFFTGWGELSPIRTSDEARSGFGKKFNNGD